MENKIQDFAKELPLNLNAKVSPFYDNDGSVNGGVFKIYREADNELVSSFMMQPMAGCRGICISKKVIVEPKFRGKGYGTTLCTFREKLASALDYSAMMCSVVVGNIPQENIMMNNGWRIINTFHNKRTGNDVNIFFKTL